MIFLCFPVRVAEEWYESDGSNPSCLRGLELARENRQQLETEQVRYATQYDGVFSTGMCVRQPPLSKLTAEAIFIQILINNLKQVKL